MPTLPNAYCHQMMTINSNNHTINHWKKYMNIEKETVPLQENNYLPVNISWRHGMTVFFLFFHFFLLSFLFASNFGNISHKSDDDAVCTAFKWFDSAGSALMTIIKSIISFNWYLCMPPVFYYHDISFGFFSFISFHYIHMIWWYS